MILPRDNRISCQTSCGTSYIVKQSVQTRNRRRLEPVEYTGLNENFQKQRETTRRAGGAHASIVGKRGFLSIRAIPSFDKASINPRPSKSVPIWFGGGVPSSLSGALLGRRLDTPNGTQ
ncbi:MAG: hypothetical protein Ct9H90mP27_1340 [Gammaproteobacteria bacterium]|nr:MAG: hypothetical protein Ct9H90mP27_1340 [Gammaproteobacteria bacterium]